MKKHPLLPRIFSCVKICHILCMTLSINKTPLIIAINVNVVISSFFPFVQGMHDCHDCPFFKLFLVFSNHTYPFYAYICAQLPRILPYSPTRSCYSLVFLTLLCPHYTCLATFLHSLFYLYLLLPRLHHYSYPISPPTPLFYSWPISRRTYLII